MNTLPNIHHLGMTNQNTVGIAEEPSIIPAETAALLDVRMIHVQMMQSAGRVEPLAQFEGILNDWVRQITGVFAQQGIAAFQHAIAVIEVNEENSIELRMMTLLEGSVLFIQFVFF